LTGTSNNVGRVSVPSSCNNALLFYLETKVIFPNWHFHGYGSEKTFVFEELYQLVLYPLMRLSAKPLHYWVVLGYCQWFDAVTCAKAPNNDIWLFNHIRVAFTF
jgi:hypothetical protein